MAGPSTALTAQVNKLGNAPADIWGVQRVVLADFTVGAKYYAPGITLNPKTLGLSEIRFAWVQAEAAGTTAYLWRYDFTNKTLRAYQQSDADNGAPLVEVTDSDTAFTPFAIRVLAFGA